MNNKSQKSSYVKTVKKTKEERKARQKKNSVFAPNHKGKFLRSLKKFLGIACMLIGALTVAVLSIRGHHYGTGWTFTHYFYLFVFLAGAFLCLSALRAEKRIARFRYYRSFMEEKEYMLLSEIEQITGRKLSFLQKDLSRMIRDGLFLQANMNQEGTCLFLTKDAFESYKRGQLILTADSESRQWEEDTAFGSEERKTEPVSHEGKAPAYENVGQEQKVQSHQSHEQKYQSYQKQEQQPQQDWEQQLHSINTMLGQIRHPDIINPVSAICIRGQQMIYFKDTNMSEEVKRILDYYLPVINTVLTTYLELEKEGLEEESSDLKIILNTIRHSFDQFVEKLIEGKRVDVEEDISAVQMLLYQM